MVFESIKKFGKKVAKKVRGPQKSKLPERMEDKLKTKKRKRKASLAKQKRKKLEEQKKIRELKEEQEDKDSGGFPNLLGDSLLGSEDSSQRDKINDDLLSTPGRKGKEFLDDNFGTPGRKGKEFLDDDLL